MKFEIYDLYKINAGNYLEAAKAILDKDGVDELIAPCCQNIGTSIELYLKGRLLQLGKDEKGVRHYGHRFMDIWFTECMSDLKNYAESSAKAHLKNIMARPGKPADPNSLKLPAEELERHLVWLQDGYSDVLKEEIGSYTLRYSPRPGKKVIVPSPEFLIPVLEDVYDKFSE